MASIIIRVYTAFSPLPSSPRLNTIPKSLRKPSQLEIGFTPRNLRRSMISTLSAIVPRDWPIIHDRCDYRFTAKFAFPNGGVGEAMATMRGSILWKPSEARVTMKEDVVGDKTIPETQEKMRARKVTLHGFLHAFVWHRIDVEDSYVLREKVWGDGGESVG
ncbi:oxidoreductase [Penicillium sp. IBT 35674x]|nr:oxidoreductase [Penicillium sp. IBT 35674x]